MDALALKLLSEIHTPIKASMYRNLNQGSIPTATFTAVQFNTQEYDYGGLISSLATVNAAFIVPQPGWYLIMGNLGFAASATNTEVASGLTRNSTTTTNLALGGFFACTAAGGTYPCCQVGGIFQLNAADAIGMVGAQNSGANGTFVGDAAGTRTWMKIHLLQEGFI